MTDEEILRRLAEILENSNLRFWPVDPLHNDAQCLALVKKYEISLSFDGLKWWADSGDLEPAWWGTDSSLNRAVCLAIIEAHK